MCLYLHCFFQAEIAAFLPKVSGGSSNAAGSSTVAELRKLMNEIESIKGERDSLEEELKAQQDDMGKMDVIDG